MKKIITLIIISSLLFQSCATIIGGAKKNIFLIDMPEDLTVSLKDKKLPIKQLLVGSESGGSVRYVYKYPGVRVKLKKGMALILQSGDKKVNVPVKITYKPGDIIVAVIGNIFFTFVAGLVLDIADGALKTAKERFIDVPALLEGKTPRSQQVLHERSKGR